MSSPKSVERNRSLLAVFPILVDLALGRRQPALIDEPLGLEVVDGLGDLVARDLR